MNSIKRTMIMSSNNKEEKSVHIVIYPWLALSHLTSFLRLANKLAERGHKISFFVPTKTQPKLSPYNHHPNHITFFPVDVPHVDGLPLGAETTNDVTLSSSSLIMTAMDLTKDTIDSHLSLLKPDFVFFEFAPWMADLAQKHGARSVHYVGPSLVRLGYVSTRARNLPANHKFTEADLMSPPPGFPCPAIGLRANEARSLAGALRMKFGGELTLLDRINMPVEECDVIVAKTCRELEGAYCEFLEKEFGKPVLLAGPMVPDQVPGSKLDDKFDGWLNGFDKGSVVYCALGSECVLDKEQFQELVLGLELTGKPFLAALKPPMECETIESALPEGFLERTKGRGIIHGGWVQQPLILQHASVGCFVTHCGLESLSEGMVNECQLVMLPQAVDQFINAQRMCMDLKIGVQIERSQNDNFFTREAVSKAILMVMEEESQVGKEVRTNHAKFRQMLLTKGLEDSYISEFLQGLIG